jgi:hypothetical protein
MLIAAASASSSAQIAHFDICSFLPHGLFHMRPVPAAVAVCLFVTCIGFVGFAALSRERSSNVELESAGDLIREAQHMKVSVADM